MTITTINEILDSILGKNSELHAHLERTAMYTFALAKALKLEPAQMEAAYFAGFLHEIGKVEINSDDHVFVGSSMIKFIEDLKYLSNDVKHQLEKWDGTGYPAGMKQDTIPLISRILAVACDYDHMRHEKQMTHEEVVEELKKGSGIKYDPSMINPFVDIIEKEDLVNLD